jgi:hypothetical protein
MDLITFIQNKYPDMIEMYHLGKHEWVDLEGKQHKEFCIHSPAFIAFPQKDITYEESGLTIEIYGKHFNLSLWKTQCITHTNIRERK